MVVLGLLSILGRKSYYSQTHVLFSLFRSHRHSSTITVRHSRSKLPITAARLATYHDRTYNQESHSITKATATFSGLTRQGTHGSAKGSRSIRKGPRTLDTRLRLQAR